ncbi:helix-turn-helix domain-containing protein [Cohnella caldifontis]|uniref:helix-turn-helix domain-containing protein n=1 Tax=Cohnella caldifontis TaxID=3027471 RepID=UPI0023EBC09C|nr:helix-turn-helix domain-containing protein [Cohnella sp. YIM B05605]
MSDLGALLRKAREQRGYTLDDIQEVTKIRKRYLEAIETGDYKVLPGSFYVRAFVKTYAETVGLDAEEVLRLYHKELPKPAAPDTPAVEPMIKKTRRSDQHRDRWGKVSVTMLMWLFPILIVAVIYVYLSQNADKDPKEVDRSPITTEKASPSESSASPSPTLPASPSAPATESSTPSVSPVTFTLKETKKSIQYIEVSPAGAHQLQLEITGRCWVGVNEGSSKGKSLLSKGFEQADVPQTLSYDLTGPLYVNVGRADNVTITVDGTPFDDGNKAGSSKFVFMPAETTLP